MPSPPPVAEPTKIEMPAPPAASCASIAALADPPETAPATAIAIAPPLAFLARIPWPALAVTAAAVTESPPPPLLFASIPVPPATAPADTDRLLEALLADPALRARIPMPPAPPVTRPAAMSSRPVPELSAQIPCPSPVTVAAEIVMSVDAASATARIPAWEPPSPATVPVAEIETAPPPRLSAWIPWPPPRIASPPALCVKAMPPLPVCVSVKALSAPEVVSTVADGHASTLRLRDPLADRLCSRDMAPTQM